LAIGRASGSCRLTPSGRSVRSHPGQPLPGLRGDLTRRGDRVGQVIDRAGEPPAPPSGGGGAFTAPVGLLLLGLGPGPAQRSFGVDQNTVGILRCGLGQVGQLTGDPTHRGQRLVLAGGATHPQLRTDHMRAFPGRP
jgi:hypothetical protein